MTKFRCNQCGAEDSDRTSSPPSVLICWKCNAGKNTKSMSQQFELMEGMFQLDESGKFPWERT